MNKIAAGVLVRNPIDNSLFLAIDRKKGNKLGISLPCGKLEDGETPDQTARRECREETGWNVFFGMLIPYSGINPDDGFEVWIFAADLDEDFGRVLPKSEDEGKMVWATAEELIAGPYGDLNRKILHHFGVNP